LVQVPDCLTMLGMQDPVDLSLIKKRLDSKTYYITLNILAADVNRMCANARIYNNAETIYYKLANRIEDFLEEYLHSHLVSEGK
jgi:histone acetyltransferase